MDRLIKFRGKSKAHNDWEYGAYYYKRPDTLWRIDNGRWLYFIEVVPETIGEFTGFKDTNDKEIFEGDFIQNDSHPELIYTVQMLDNGTWSGIFIDDEDEAPLLSWLLDNAPFKVIGNIYDNPELLEGGKADD